MRALTLAGRSFFAIAVVGSGTMQIVNASFVRLVPPLPVWVPWQSGLAVATGVVLVVVGLAILIGRKRQFSALTIGAILALIFLLLALPRALSDPLTGFMWTNPAKTLALMGGALLLAGSNTIHASSGLNSRALPFAKTLLAIFLIICGSQHFVYAGFVDTLVPAWIPPGQRFWTCFTGVALLACGVGILFPRTARPAALLSGLMISLWVVLLHIPRAATEANQANELAGVFEALAVSGVALLIAAAIPSRTATPRPSV